MAVPKWLDLARQELGTKEFPGPTHNPVVQQYYIDSVSHKYADEVPWCAAFVGAMLVRAGETPSGSLLARSYLRWGVKLKQPKAGAIVVFPRGTSWQGHVAFIEQVGKNTLTVIGGNQKNAVTREVYPRGKAIGYRWPKGEWK